MCLFSQPIRHVSKTRIFARSVTRTETRTPSAAVAADRFDRQFLAYSMKLDADGDLAMVLPIPVPPSTTEDAVRFIDMSSCKTFFAHLDELFPALVQAAFGGAVALRAPQPQPLLIVHAVGDFEASFVPSRRDFDRLDPRFRLAPGVWDALPAYADWGFCVFKLRAGAAASPFPPAAPPPFAPITTGAETRKKRGLVDRVFGIFSSSGSSGAEEGAQGSHGSPPSPTREFHPMAFEFPRRNGGLFFPTVHVHDGAVHATARFDHTLYCQAASPPNGWEASMMPVGTLPRDALEWVDQGQRIHRRVLIGDHPNRDVIVAES